MHTLLGVLTLLVSSGLVAVVAGLNVAMYLQTQDGPALVLLCCLSLGSDVLKVLLSYGASLALGKGSRREGTLFAVLAVVLSLWSGATVASAWQALTSPEQQAAGSAHSKAVLASREAELSRLPPARPLAVVTLDIAAIDADHAAQRVDCSALAAAAVARKSCKGLAALRIELETARERDTLGADIRALQAKVEKVLSVKPKRDYVADTLPPAIKAYSGFVVAVFLELLCLCGAPLARYFFGCTKAARQQRVTEAQRMVHRAVGAPEQCTSGAPVVHPSSADAPQPKPLNELRLVHAQGAPQAVRQGAPQGAPKCSEAVLEAVLEAVRGAPCGADGWRTVSQRAMGVSPSSVKRALGALLDKGEIQLDTSGRTTRVKLVSGPALRAVV